MQKLLGVFASLALILSFSVFSSWAIRSPNSYLVNYWNTHVYKGALPEFLMSRASPLTTAESITFAQLANQNALSSHIDSFCASANLLCSTGSTSSQAELLDELIGTEKLSLRSSKNDNSLASDKHGEVKVEPGLFFREKDIKTGNVVPMPDYIDRLPKRSFLPRTIASKLPFSSSKLPEIRKIFHATEHSTLDTILKHSLHMCEQAPIAGEAQSCVSSAEDMIDFAVSSLGTKAVEAKVVENVKGLKTNVLLGDVKKINGGQATVVVSCHQRLYPYLLYQCHRIPNNHVYQVDLLDQHTKAKISSATAICHLDAAEFSSHPEVFTALGSAPGKTEVCHFMKEGDLLWVASE